MLHGGVTPDEVSGLVLLPGLEVAHLFDGYMNCGQTDKRLE